MLVRTLPALAALFLIFQYDEAGAVVDPSAVCVLSIVPAGPHSRLFVTLVPRRWLLVYSVAECKRADTTARLGLW